MCVAAAAYFPRPQDALGEQLLAVRARREHDDREHDDQVVLFSTTATPDPATTGPRAP